MALAALAIAAGAFARAYATPAPRQYVAEDQV
jgi:hypothetical protein